MSPFGSEFDPSSFCIYDYHNYNMEKLSTNLYDINHF